MRRLSFRDPGGSVFAAKGRIFRIINQSSQEELYGIWETQTVCNLIDTGRLVKTIVADREAIAELLADEDYRNETMNIHKFFVVEHERIPFVSFPYEWPPEMLHAAGVLTLRMNIELLREGIGLKDATPYNVVFVGPNPIFIDLLSLERRDKHDSTWLPYAQFVRTFVLPTIANKYFELSMDDIFLARRDGLEPQEVYALCGVLQKFMPPFLTTVSLPTWIGDRHRPDDNTIYQKKRSPNPEKAMFVLQSLLRRLQRSFYGLAPRRGKESKWSDYMECDNSYSPEQMAYKEEFVKSFIAHYGPRKVLDVGCNTGRFSLMAAQAGGSVVAIDYDPTVVGEVWHKAREDKLDILPLVINLSRPSPATGWLNSECSSFLDRAYGTFDTVFMLAVLHHMIVTERIPLESIIDLVAKLTTDFIVIEYVDPADKMFRRITRGRDELFLHLTREGFEETCRRQFDIVRSEHIPDSERWLYMLRKRKA
jgi:SAM-dependent methyltransferase